MDINKYYIFGLFNSLWWQICSYLNVLCLCTLYKCFDLPVAKIQPCYQRRDFDLVVYAHLIRTVSLNVFLMFHSTL